MTPEYFYETYTPGTHPSIQKIPAKLDNSDGAGYRINEGGENND